ncbi:MAG: hypothetical protein FD153_835 [Rhodospirillaceae bacterium]|nr:MAG: hypothetical protein FD153_835 [Rhodospirillaceae bacterium]
MSGTLSVIQNRLDQGLIGATTAFCHQKRTKNRIREPLVDVFDKGAEIMVTAELPGVAEEDATVTATADALSLETSGAYHFRQGNPASRQD